MSHNHSGSNNKKFVRDEDRAVNMWLDLVDKLLERKMPIINAMYYAGEQLQENQQRSGQTLFHPTDLWVATQEINLLLRRCPEFQTRKSGWAKEQQHIDY